MISFVKVLVLLSSVSYTAFGQASTAGGLNKDIYTFLKSNQQTSKVIENFNHLNIISEF